MRRIKVGVVGMSMLLTFAFATGAQATRPITRNRATGTSLAETRGETGAAADDATPAAAVTISAPLSGATLASSPVAMRGTASASSGVKSVAVDGVAASISGGDWTASVPFANLGRNTFAATVTSNDGNTATATAAVWYTPPASVGLKTERFNGSALLVTLACAVTGSWCPGRIRLRYTETVVRHHRRHTTTVTIVSKHFGLTSGQTATVSAGLDGIGRELLTLHGKLAVRGSVTITVRGGYTETAARFRIILKRPKKPRR
jgi:hypothetical protein